MASTNFTEHYDIPLPLGSDKTTPMDYNTSMQAVDTALFTAQGDASDAKTGLATTNQNVAQNAQDISSLAGRVTTAEGTINSQGTQITNLSNKIDRVEQDAQDMICAYNEGSATASRNYAVGDYFIYNDVLYRATQAISKNSTIVPDTNCTTTNVTSEIKGFSPDLSAYQTKQDNALETISKEVVGAINEIAGAYQKKQDNALTTDSKQVVGAINELKSDMTKNTVGTAVDVSSYSSTSYVFPSDGYLAAVGVDGQVTGAVYDANNVYIAAFNCNAGNSETLFVRKGMKCTCSTRTGSSAIKFMPLS